jgi:hypothetical protein
LKTASGVAHLLQNCRDNPRMNYGETAKYLRTNSILIDNQNSIKTPSRLMKLEHASPSQEEKPTKSFEQDRVEPQC